jgi:anti-sigma factor RsiW
MGCPLFEKTSAYFDGEMAEADSGAFKAHLDGCAECSGELARLRRMVNFLSVAKVPDVARARNVFRARLNTQRVSRFATVLTAIAAMVMLVSGISLALRGSGGGGSSSWQQVAVNAQAETPQEDPMIMAFLRDKP